MDLLRLINKQPIKPSDVRPTKAQKGPVGHSMNQKMGQLCLCPVRSREDYKGPNKDQKGSVGHSMAQKMGQFCPVRPSETY